MTPVILYTSAGLPLGARAVIKFFRPPTQDDPSPNYPDGYTKPKIAKVVPFGSEDDGTLLGQYVIEDVSINLNGTPVTRQGTFGEDSGDPALVRQAPTLSMTAQMAAAGTPTLCPGDYCVVFIGMKATSTGAVPLPIAASRWFVGTDGVSGNQNAANKFGLSLIHDRANSDPALSEF